MSDHVRKAVRESAPATPAGKSAYDLVMEARPALSIPPADCTNACSDGLCDCSGESRVRGWAVDIPALRVLLAPATLIDAREQITSYLRQWASALVEVRGSEADKEAAWWMRRGADLLELDGAVSAVGEELSAPASQDAPVAEVAEILASALHEHNIGHDLHGWQEVSEAFALVKDILNSTRLDAPEDDDD